MAYTINYDQNKNHKYSASSERKINHKYLVAVLSVIVILVVWMITPVRLAVLDFLLPGNGAVTRQAVGNMINDLKQGQTFKDAFTDFCIEIVENA